MCQGGGDGCGQESLCQICVKALLIISSWFGMLQRSGVWTFYEATNPKEIADAVNDLKNRKKMNWRNYLKKQYIIIIILFMRINLFILMNG